MHGLCGCDNLKSLCMVDGKCHRRYLGPFVSETFVRDYNFSVYWWRRTSTTISNNGVLLDNRYVVPHNLDLVAKHDCHINIEKTNYDNIKYLCKYMYKGTDKFTIFLKGQRILTNDEGNNCGQHVDKIKQFMDCRCISASKGCWKISLMIFNR